MKAPPDKLVEALVSEAEIAERKACIRSLADKPLYFYGAGFYARELKEFLGLHGVFPNACFVDPPYVKRASLDDLDIRSINELESLEPPFTIAIAHCHDLEGTLRTLQKDHKINPECLVIIECRFFKRFRQFEEYVKNTALQDFEQVYQWLEDDLSRQTLIAYLNAKIMQDSSALRALKNNHQYFPDDLTAFTPKQSDTYIDAGAFTGDTLAELLELIPGQYPSKYVAFEPDPDNLKSLRNLVACRNLSFVDIHPTGVWSHPSKLRFSSSDDSRSGLSDAGDVEIQVETIDSLHMPATCIKMDIEGAELEALHGARRTIINFRPRLTLAAYHKPEDMREIPHLIKQFSPDYKFYLRIHSSFSEELVLYAVVE
jgi:FkbM family methyltransferase